MAPNLDPNTTINKVGRMFGLAIASVLAFGLLLAVAIGLTKLLLWMVNL